MQKYWDERYQTHGNRTVGHISFDEEKFREVSKKIAQMIRRKVRPYLLEKVVLDFGCGSGRNVPILLESALIVYGIDISRWAIKQATVYEPKGIFFHYDGSSIPFEDRFFDTVFSWTVLQHVPNEEIEKVAKEIQRVLNPLGHLVAYENVSTWYPDKEHIWFREPSTYRKLFSDCKLIDAGIIDNLDEVKEKEAHYLMVFQKIPIQRKEKDNDQIRG